MMNLCILAVVPWREMLRSGQNNSGLYVVSLFMQRIYGAWAARTVTALVIVAAFASVFSLMLGYSRVPYAAALDGNYFKAFAKVHPVYRFPHVSLLALGVVAAAFCFLRLQDAIAALVVIRLILQFLVQAIGLIVYRITRPEVPRPFRMWLYPVPALAAIAGFLFILFNRRNWQKEIRYAVVILLAGLAIYMIRSWRSGEWPFAWRVSVIMLQSSEDCIFAFERGNDEKKIVGLTLCLLALVVCSAAHENKSKNEHRSVTQILDHTVSNIRA